MISEIALHNTNTRVGKYGYLLTSTVQWVDILATDTTVMNVGKCIQHAITVIAHSSFGVAIDTDWLVVIKTTE